MTTGSSDAFDDSGEFGWEVPQFHPFSGLRAADIADGCRVTRILLNELAAISESGSGPDAQSRFNVAVVDAIYMLEQRIVAIGRP